MRFLRPMAFLRRQAILRGVLGGQRKWMIWGGAAWVIHGVGRVLGSGELETKLVEELKPGETMVIVHEGASPLEQKRAARRRRVELKREARSSS